MKDGTVYRKSQAPQHALHARLEKQEEALAKSEQLAKAQRLLTKAQSDDYRHLPKSDAAKVYLLEKIEECPSEELRKELD